MTSSRLGSLISSLPLIILCVNVLTGELLPGCTITVSPQAVFGTGGHNHDGAKPAGCFLKSGEVLTLCLSSGTQPVVITRSVTDVTGSNGTFPVLYVAPEPSGEVTVSLTGTAPDGTPLIPGGFTIGVSIPGLEALPPGDNYVLSGAKTRHPDNHFGAPTFNASLVNLADRYATVFPGQRLSYNDISLVEGGLFDIREATNWRLPHRTHRFGTDVDMRLVPVANRDRLRQLIRARGSGIRTIIEETDPPHWHLRQ